MLTAMIYSCKGHRGIIYLSKPLSDFKGHTQTLLVSLFVSSKKFTTWL